MFANQPSSTKTANPAISSKFSIKSLKLWEGYMYALVYRPRVA
jgi:hypothetical protein